ncbi:hypothetical protein P152DRAFT_477829 [Eremomyces bilateralis CBS 781.70]|uniref:Uncharacterized protein n=1 Tax=Eremomyces bilateralis CBS 781.70 TaxID=1392243 RepID=A0A6G1FQ83_9PEZI|nr:uncharacterized protein P152DRAFT_477829 [Eremomyces bilateralis CBS 781.70]KAF1807851.1 hypothetical protein P152DRAFT_477829 [Eremomyces bilateralis CBS 781.70]
MSTSANDLAVIVKAAPPLKSPADWRDWYNFIKSHGNRVRVWKYIDPTTEEDPEEPQTYSKEEYNKLTEYDRDQITQSRKLEENVHKAKVRIGDIIFAIVPEEARRGFSINDTPRQMLSYLKSRYGPDENQYEELVETAWERLRVRPKRMKLQDWILEWKHFKEYAEELGQKTTYTDLKLIRELIKICRREDLDRFSTRSEDAIWVAREPGGNPAHLKLNHHIELFLKTYPMEIPKPTKGALFATLQGETPEQTSQPSQMPPAAASPSSTPVPPQ